MRSLGGTEHFLQLGYIKKPLLILSLFANLIFAGVAFAPLLNQVAFDRQKKLPVQPLVSLKNFRIAVVAPAPCESIDDICNGFKSVTNSSTQAHYSYQIYYSNSNRTLLRSMIESILDTGYDLIFTIGIHCSIMAHEISKKKKILTPIVFSAVDFPVTYNLVESLTSSGNHVTGAASETVARYVEQLEYFFYLNPKVSKVILPYNPSLHFSEKSNMNDVINFLKKRNIDTVLVEVFNSNEVIEKISPFVVENAVIMTLRDATVMVAIDALVKLCNNQGACIFTSDLGAIKKGAAIGFGSSEAETGVEAANKAVQILEQDISPSNIPVTVPNYKYKLVINSATMKKQKLEIDPLYLFLMENAEVI